jgi:hypothetical protein
VKLEKSHEMFTGELRKVQQPKMKTKTPPNPRPDGVQEKEKDNQIS